MNESDAFIKKAESELRDINRRETKLAEQDDMIKRQRAELRARSAEVSRTLSVYKQIMGVDTIQPDVDKPGTAESLSEGTIADVAEDVLKANARPMTTNELVEELQRRGKLKDGGESGRGPYGTAYRTLLRDKRFVRVDKGIFGLKAWPD
jgi:hypothetical protein